MKQSSPRRAPGFYMNPAHKIIAMFGGPGPLARLLNLNRSTVWRWQVSSEERKHGKDGVVPPELQQKLIDLAKANLGKTLKRDAFFPTYEKVPINREARESGPAAKPDQARAA